MFKVFPEVIISQKITDQARLVAGLMSAIGFTKFIAQFLQVSQISFTTNDIAASPLRPNPI